MVRSSTRGRLGGDSVGWLACAVCGLRVFKRVCSWVHSLITLNFGHRTQTNGRTAHDGISSINIKTLQTYVARLYATTPYINLKNIKDLFLAFAPWAR